MKILFLFFIILSSFSCNSKHYKEPHIVIYTGLGDIEAELYPEKAPKTTAAFMENIKNDLYTNGSFYRVLKADEMPSDFNTGIIQGGTWQNINGKTLPKGIEHESTELSGLSHTDGTLSFARTKPGTATTEFFICIGDQSQYDAGRRGTQDSLGFAAFGKVINGMDIVRKILDKRAHGEKFDEPIKINSIKQL
jgi:peptidyl-prolyl cis-trans isomerase A (cyclophilin A)